MASSLTYKQSGVDIEAGNQLVESIKTVAKRTYRPGVLAGLGGFGAMFELPLDRYTHPVLVSGTDGVGTKLKLAIECQQHDTIGIDLVAMCANDIIVQGAEPLFFLDYYATGKLSLATAQAIIKGIGRGCELAGAALIGGETAEMPGIYQADDYDLAGFCVGIVEKANIIDGSKVAVDDVLIGLTSSGPHANGYSLIRKILSTSNIPLTQAFGKQTIGEVLLSPTKIYVAALLKLMQTIDVHALAHITGGGLLDNIPRVMPDHTKAVINSSAWQRPEIFNWLQQQGNISPEEMYRTFNCGIGMVICVAKQDADAAIKLLNQCGETALMIGKVITHTSTKPIVDIT